MCAGERKEFCVYFEFTVIELSTLARIKQLKRHANHLLVLLGDLVHGMFSEHSSRDGVAHAASDVLRRRQIAEHQPG